MLTKEELNHSYIRYRPEITEEIFKRIIDKVEELGFKQYSNSNDYENFVSNNLALGNPDYTWYVVKPKYMDNSRSEIKVLDILGDGWENVDTGVEKWSVGSYIVPLQNKLLSRSEPLTKGKPYKIITYTCIPYILDDTSREINFVDDSDAEEKEGIKWFATLAEAEAFSKSLLKPEEPEPLTVDSLIEKGIVIKGEFYNLPGYAIFEAGKNGYIGNNGIDWRPHCDNNWEGPEDFILATPEEKKWVITCRKQNRFIPQDQLNMYDSDGNLIENKPKPKQFEFNKWYKRIEPECSKILIFVYDNGYYGFNLDGKWFNAPYFDYSKSDKEKLISATKKEVEERFISYAKEKYPIGTKFNSTGGNKDCVIDENSSYILDLDGDILVKNSKNKFIGRLFSRSTLKWAEIIEEDVSVINQPIESKLNMKEEIVKFKSGDKIVGKATCGE